jgi:hypothetical protein
LRPGLERREIAYNCCSCAALSWKVSGDIRHFTYAIVKAQSRDLRPTLKRQLARGSARTAVLMSVR